MTTWYLRFRRIFFFLNVRISVYNQLVRVNISNRRGCCDQAHCSRWKLCTSSGARETVPLLRRRASGSWSSTRNETHRNLMHLYSLVGYFNTRCTYGQVVTYTHVVHIHMSRHLHTCNTHTNKWVPEHKWCTYRQAGTWTHMVRIQISRSKPIHKSLKSKNKDYSHSILLFQ